MPQASREEVGRELSDLGFGIVEQNWLEQHIGKVVNLKALDQLQLNVAEWELTYFILFAITSGCGTFSAADSARTTAILKAFHTTFFSHIAEQAGLEVAAEHKKNLPARSEQHIGKVVNLKALDQLQLNVAEWELTYFILFAITSGCGTFSAADSARTTAILKAFHTTFFSHIAEQAGLEVAAEHKKNLPA